MLGGCVDGAVVDPAGGGGGGSLGVVEAKVAFTVLLPAIRTTQLFAETGEHPDHEVNL